MPVLLTWWARPATTNQYDSYGDLVAVTDQEDNKTLFKYNSNHGLVDIIDPRGVGVARNIYDDEGRLVAIVDADGNRVDFTHDGDARQEVVNDRLGNVTVYEYDVDGNVVSKTNALGNKTTYTYDARGNKLTETDPLGNTTTYTYDALNRLATVSDPDGGVTAYTYDAVGNRASITYPNTTVTQYTYDALNRLTNLLNRTGGGSTISSYAYTLGPAGNRTRVVEDTGRIVDYTYDALHRLIRETITKRADVTTIDYMYDPVGNRLTKAVATTTGTTTTTYVYDNNDRLITETVAVARLTTPQGEVQYASFSRPSAAAPYMRDGFLTVSLLCLLVPLAITWVKVSHLGRRARRQRSCISALCVFLIPMFVLGADSVLAIDRQATLYTAMTATGLMQLPGPTMYTYAYDNNGNTTSRTDGIDTDTYIYDYENRLTSANIQLGSTPGPVSYTYDAEGIRTSKSAGGTTTSFLVDKNRPFAQVLVETAGATTVSYVHGDDLISMKRSTGTSYYLYDGQMSTRQLTNPAQTVTDTYTYDAFGIELYHTGTTVNNYKYTGEQYDPNMGFYYLRARYYNQGTGRFVTMDPFPGTVFDPMSLHKYLYAHANPVMNLIRVGDSRW